MSNEGEQLRRCLTRWAYCPNERSIMYVFTIAAEHVGQPTVKVRGHVYLTSNWIGRILPSDVGKRVYLTGSVLQVENDQQRQARIGRCIRTSRITGEQCPNPAEDGSDICITHRHQDAYDAASAAGRYQGD